MSARFARLFDFSPYSRTFIPASDAVLRPYEARSRDILTQRNITVDRGYGHLTDAEIVQIARNARSAYLAAAIPRWARAGAAGIGNAPAKAAVAIRWGFDALSRRLEGAEGVRRERWLAQSVDVHDLERRIRALERNGILGAY